MAKRRKVEEETLFKEPEFDEREFLKNEMKKGKGIIIVFLLAVAIGILSAYVQIYIGVYVSCLIGILLVINIKPILRFFNAEFSDRNTWIYAIIAFVILWIAFWSVGLNPPFNDVSPPQIRTVEVLYNGTWVVVYDYSAKFSPDLNEKIKENRENVDWNKISAIRAKITDNVQVGEVFINGKSAMVNGDYYQVNVGDENVASIDITAKDISGHVSTFHLSVPTGT